MINYTPNPDYFEEEDYVESLLSLEPYRYQFDDGSAIIIKEEEIQLTYPRIKTKKLWMCEELNNLIEKHQWDRQSAIEYIEKNYD